MCGPPEKPGSFWTTYWELEAEQRKRLALIEKQIEKEKHLSDVEFVNQNGRGK